MLKSKKNSKKVEYQLGPCPFCDGTRPYSISMRDLSPELIHNEHPYAYFVRCVACGAEGPHHYSPIEAVNAWNQRVVRVG